MKTFLKIDIGAQILLFLMLLAGIFGAIFNLQIIGGIIFFFIFMGIWQPVSSFIHLLLNFSKERAIYLLSAIGYVFLTPQMINSFDWLVPLYFLGAFAFSIWYFRISYLHFKRLEDASRSFWDLA